MMRTRIVALAAPLTAMILASAPAHADSWKRLRPDKLGFSMRVPRKAKVVDMVWPGGWDGIQAQGKGVKLFGISMLGKKNTAALIRGFAEQITSLERKHWTVKKTVKAKGGWVWYTIARAAHGDKVATAVYGLGPKGTFLMLLVSTKKKARKDRAAHARWSRTVKLK